MQKAIHNTAEIRSLNKKKIINYLRNNDPITKKDLSNKLDLSFATVSNICNQLMDEMIIVITSSENSSGGRIPGLLSINPLSKYSLCINLAKKNYLQASLVDLKGDIVLIREQKVDFITSYEILVDHILVFLNDLIKGSRIPLNRFLGIGISIPGIVNKNNECIVSSNLPVLENKFLKQTIEKSILIPAFIENDSNLLALSSILYDKRSMKSKDIIYLYIGEGLGGGIICNGALVKGSLGIGGEIGHVPIGIRHYPCYCGNIGCIETELCLSGFLRKFNTLTRYESNSFTFNDWENFLKEVYLDNKQALAVIEENGKLCGILISILISFFDPEIFYIGGITETIYDKLLPFIMEELNRRIIPIKKPELHLFNSPDFERLIFKGCSELVFNEWTP